MTKHVLVANRIKNKGLHSNLLELCLHGSTGAGAGDMPEMIHLCLVKLHMENTLSNKRTNLVARGYKFHIERRIVEAKG